MTRKDALAALDAYLDILFQEHAFPTAEGILKFMEDDIKMLPPKHKSKKQKNIAGLTSNSWESEKNDLTSAASAASAI